MPRLFSPSARSANPWNLQHSAGGRATRATLRRGRPMSPARSPRFARPIPPPQWLKSRMRSPSRARPFSTTAMAKPSRRLEVQAAIDLLAAWLPPPPNPQPCQSPGRQWWRGGGRRELLRRRRRLWPGRERALPGTRPGAQRTAGAGSGSRPGRAFGGHQAEGVLITSIRSSVMSSIANLTPSRPIPLSLTPP